MKHLPTRIALCFALLLLPMPIWAETMTEQDDILREMGIPVSQGAAAGYVPDQVCAQCHADKAESFAEMGMARSFYSPSPEKVIEDFAQSPYFHEPSQRYYEMELRGDEYWFTRYGLASDGSRIDVFSVKVDWVLGSGNHSRIYLYQTPDGALFQLPLSWYTQEGIWAMAPGYEFPEHEGVMRAVSTRCMACHNSYAAYSENSGKAGHPMLFPEDLPEGISCQRCHGPGAEHVSKAYSGEADLDALHSAIVNPGKLAREELYSICYGCHMQPTATVNGQLRLGREEFSFRPGQSLGDFIVKMDIEDAQIAHDDRFEINHHPYRMEQSACFIESEGQLGCLSCHDPHVKIKPEERAAHYRDACLACHETDDAGLPEMAAADAVHPTISASDDCTACHMPERRTQDVVEVTMTDHKIVRDPGPESELLAPITSQKVEVERIMLADPDQPLPEGEKAALALMSVLEYSAFASTTAARDLHQVLVQGKVEHYEPWLVLLQSYVTQQNFAAARQIAGKVLSLAPENPKAVTAVAVVLYRTGDPAQAVSILRRVVDSLPDNIEPRVHLARFLADQGQVPEALAHAEKVVELRPNHWQGWTLLANLKRAMGENERAIEAYLSALDIRPESTGVRRATIEMLDAAGRKDDAARHRTRLSE